MLTQDEIKMLNLAILTKTASLQRSINTEQDEDVKQMRQKQLTQYNNLQAKINTKGLFDETHVGKQEKQR